MGKYILRRLLVMIPTLLFVVFIIFAILQFSGNSIFQRKLLLCLCFLTNGK